MAHEHGWDVFSRIKIKVVRLLFVLFYRVSVYQLTKLSNSLLSLSAL